MRILFLIFILASPVWAQEQAESKKKSIAELSMMADFQCLQIRFEGICPKPERIEFPVGVKIRYWQPEVFMETVKIPGDYTIAEYGIVLEGMAKLAAQTELRIVTGIDDLKVTSGSSSQSLGISNLQFNEVHLYDYPLGEIFEDAVCSDIPNQTLGIRYLSEADSIAWRRADIEKNLPQSLVAARIGSQCHRLPLGAEGQCMKNWGPLYPRQGFVITASAAMASIVDAMRSLSIAAEGLPAHVVESKLDFQPNIPIDKVQMVYPAKTSCFPIGENPGLWEQNKQSKGGHYVWIYWHQRSCCI